MEFIFFLVSVKMVEREFVQSAEKREWHIGKPFDSYR